MNLKDELIRERENRKAIDPAVDFSLEAFNIIHEEVYHEHDIRTRLKNSLNHTAIDLLPFLEPENLFMVDEIKNLCINYRLRFLDSSYFNQEYPQKAVSKIKELERRFNREFTDFKVVAPSKVFKLKDCDDDPLLFLKIDEDVFYLIHQWGKDVSVWRKYLMYPFRNFINLLSAVLIVAVLAATFTPLDIDENSIIKSELIVRSSIFMFVSVSLASIFTFIGFAFMKSFSENQWNSPFFKQH